MHPACASLITRCVLDRTPVPVPVSQQVPLKTKRGANFHFHFYTSILSRCSHPDRPGTSYIQYLVNAVSHSLSRSCRAVPCVVFVTLTWTLEPDLLDSKEPAIPPPSLFLHHHLAVDLVLNPPPSFYSAGKPASQPDLFFSPGAAPSSDYSTEPAWPARTQSVLWNLGTSVHLSIQHLPRIGPGPGP